MTTAQGRSAQQLAEVLATLAASSTEAGAALGGAERIAECFEADVAAILKGDEVQAAVGFRRDSLPLAEMLAVDKGLRREIYVPGAGTCLATVVPVPSEPPRRLVLARSGEDGFSLEEISLLLSMGRILATALDMIALRDRVATSETRFRRVVETANEGIWLFDSEGHTAFANEKTAEILGYAPEDMQALSLFDALDDTGKAQAAKDLERRRQGLSDQLEARFLRKDRSYVWVLVNASPLFDVDGQYAGSVCLMSDITQRKHIEEVLHQREQQLAEAQRVAGLGSFQWDVSSGRLECSDELFRLLGLQPGRATFTYDDYLERVHPADRWALTNRVADAVDGSGVYEIQHRIVRPSGEVVWVEAHAEVVRDPEGGVPLLVRGTAQNITTSKHVETALRETTARYRLLQAMASAANEASTLEEALQVAVEEICVHTGWAVGHASVIPDATTAEGQAPAPIWHVSDPVRFDQLAAARAILDSADGSAGGMAGGLAGEVQGSGKPCWASPLREETASPLEQVALDLGLRGEFCFPVMLGADVACVLAFFTDQALDPDDGLLETVDHVANQLSRVAERERASIELAGARDAAMESSRLKSDFLATMSHEIRTPMNGVIGLTSLLLSTDLDIQQQQYAEGVQSAGEALLAIINDILDFSKIEAGKLELEVVDFDLVQMVEEAAGLVAQAAQRKRLELVVHCSPDLPAGMRGDPARLRQVLLNLAANAVKFTAEGEVVLRAELVEECGDRLTVRFEVTDTGIGIADADRARLFEPFSQADASTTRRFGGTGLGLAISRRIVDAMGGDLGLESEPGRGSVFFFTVPLTRQAEPVAALRPSVDVPLTGLRVLVVDDNETNRIVLHDQLAAWGLAAELAEDADGALAQLAAAADAGAPFDVALLDADMPGTDGLELALRITRRPALAGTRLVMLTSSMDAIAVESRRAGISTRLTKPVRLSQLYECLQGARGPVAAAVPVIGPADAPATGSLGHVLVVEDNANNQLVAVGLLRLLGYRADVAANGYEALDALDRAEFSAVLMDCQMPDMDGFTATAEIRRREVKSGLPHTPVIAMTAGASQGDQERCLAAGMDDYLAKPVTSRDVKAKLDQWVHAGTSTGRQRDHDASPIAATGPGVLDDSILDDLRGLSDDGAIFVQVVEVFEATRLARFAALAAAVADADGARVRKLAHSLRGEASTLGAVALAARCAELEELSHAGRSDRAPELLAAIEVELARAAEALHGAVARVA